MCAGALVLGRLDRLVYGCPDPKTGACGSLYDIVRDERLNHRLEVTSGVLADDCTALLRPSSANAAPAATTPPRANDRRDSRPTRDALCWPPGTADIPSTTLPALRTNGTTKGWIV
jgi:hypothetical protein